MAKLFTLLIILSFFISCNQQIEEIGFKSDWSDNPTIERHWAGADYWLNPLHSWLQKDGKLHVIAPGGDRKCVLLTQELSGEEGEFSIVARFENKADSVSSGWAGFQIGLKGAFNDFRDDAVHGRGFCVGVTMGGHLFMGDTLMKNEIIVPVTEFDLKLTGTPVGEGKLQLNLFYFDLEGTMISSIKKTVHSSWVNGLIALSCSTAFPDTTKLGEEKPYFYKIKNLGKNNAGEVKFSFSNWNLEGEKFREFSERKYGPILWCQYTLSDNILKLSAQFAPIGNDSKIASLYVNGKQVASEEIDKYGNNAIFKINNWKSKIDHKYKVVYISKNKEEFSYSGLIRKDLDDEKIIVASLSCSDDVGFPHQDLVNNVMAHRPDVYLFHGDQIYERVGGYGVKYSNKLDYLNKWYIWGWSFRDCIRNRPAVIIPDDHDVFHGNLWGEGGKRADVSLGWGYAGQDDGGYKEPPDFVNLVHRTQTGHLPDPYDATPALNDISVYYTNMNYAGISFAILGDRQWKSAPKNKLPVAEIENGWPQNKNWNAKTDAYHPDAELLGARQEVFLEQWVEDWAANIQFKVVVSQSPFCNVATLPKDIYHDKYVPGLPRYRKGEYPPDDRPVADFDANAWPQNKRDKAIKIIRKAFAIHLTGDQHLGSTGQYGVDDFGDAGYWVSSPAVSNLWPRRWFPAEIAPSGRGKDDARYKGDYEDGFGNKITVKAVANPHDIDLEPERVYDKAPGYSIIVFDKIKRKIEAAVWPRWASPENEIGFNAPYDDWPIAIDPLANYGRRPIGFLKKIKVNGNEVLKLFSENSGELIYAINPPAGEFRPMVFDNNISYKIQKLNGEVIAEELTGLKIE